jgi:LacI family transcriptional regulator
MIYHGAFNQEKGYELTMQSMEHSPKPTALFGANNFITIGILKALKDLKVHVPGDVSVVGFDDLPESMLITTFLTVAAQPAYEMGKVATERLLQRISGELSELPKEVIFSVEIIERRSAGPIATD